MSEVKSSGMEDIQEFVEAAEGFEESPSNKNEKLSRTLSGSSFDEDDEEGSISAGAPVQYAHFRGGFMPTTTTVDTIPPGSYNIEVSDAGIYASPALPPSGLLLELPQMRSDEVIRIVENFWESEKDYKIGNDFVIGGAQYKAGIMLYGPPGSGKSCTIKIVSKKLIEKGGTVFNCNINPEYVAAFLEKFAKIEKNRKSIVILEDIDSLIERYGESRYLEMLDSAQTIDNVLFIATTNYPDRLDPRIYNRPGRFSHVVKIGNPTKLAREAFLMKVLKNHKDVEFIVNNSDGFSIDHLSALINATYREKKDLKEEIERLKTLFKIPRVDGKTIGLASD